MIDLDALKANSKAKIVRQINGKDVSFPRGHLLSGEQLDALIAELRAARKVVEAARRIGESTNYTPLAAWVEFDTALSEYEGLK